jgi:hypothetical protein
LVFPAGEINSADLWNALSRQVNIKLFGACSVERLGRHLFRNYRNDLPFISSPRFLIEFNALLRTWAIDLVIPTHDTVVQFLADNADDIATKMMLPGAATAAICRDKRLTCEVFANCSFLPRVYWAPEDVDNHDVFVKPARGQGSVGARRIRREDPTFAQINWNEEVVTEYLPGEEMTVDCFTDRHGELLGVFPRSRDRILGGISVAGKALRADDEVIRIAEDINNRLDFLGMWYFQVKKDHGESFKLLEISARCAGAQCLTRARGVNLPLLSIYAAMGRDVEITENAYQVRMDRTLTAMYDISYEYDHVFIDYDDTIVTSLGVDPDIMRLLYQFRNEGVDITLLSRHEGDLLESLQSNCIPTSLFSNIVHLKEGQSKADYIRGRHSIFIDNAFSERFAVQQKHDIPVFDVDTTEVLQKWTR